MISPSNNSNNSARIVHTADVHLVSGDQRELSLSALEQVMLIAENEAADAILIAGDFYDRAVDNTEASPLGRAAHLLREAPCAVVLLDGNHDPRRALRMHAIPGKVQILDEPLQVLIPTASGSQLLISAMPYPDKGHLLAQLQDLTLEQANARMLSNIRDMFLGFGAAAQDHPFPHVAMFHGNVLGAELHNRQIMLEEDVLIPADYFGLTGAAYTALGHIHKPQHMGFGAYYSGSPWAVDHGDLGAKAVNVVLVHRDGYEIAYRPINTPVKHTEKVQANETAQGLASWGWLDEFHRPDTVSPQLVDLKLKVAVPKDLASQLNSDGIREQALAAGFRSVRIERDVQREDRVRAAELREAITLRSKVESWAGAVGTKPPQEALLAAEEFEVAYRRGMS